jgi:hypothetical protein
MEDEILNKVKNVLTEWNPLGEYASKIEDLNEYESEACDILFFIDTEIMYKKSKDTQKRILKIVRQILNEAFNLDLTNEDCAKPSEKIYQIINEN